MKVPRWAPPAPDDEGTLLGRAEAAPDLIEVPDAWAALPPGRESAGLPTGPCLYASGARGLAARFTEAELWGQAYGRHGLYGRAHLWHGHSVYFHAYGRDIAAAIAGFQLGRHEATVLICDLRRADRWDRQSQQRVPLPPPPCGHDGDLLYRAVCRMPGCDWEGPEHPARVRPGENLAVEDGMDHAWPGWRDLPVVARVPEHGGNPDTKKARQTLGAWAAKVNAVYPENWLEDGGPIRTQRSGLGTRHVECSTPYGGWDLSYDPAQDNTQLELDLR